MRSIIYDGYIKDINYYRNNKIKLNISKDIDNTFHSMMDEWMNEIRDVVNNISNNFIIPQNLIEKISNIFIDEHEKRLNEYKTEVKDFFKNYSKGHGKK